MSAEWKMVCGWPRYEVSRDGQVRDAKTHRLVKQRSLAKRGNYLVVNLYEPGGQRGVYKRHMVARVHRLVCEAFHGAAPKGRPDVAHNNGNKLDNNAENLRWASAKENAQDSILLGALRPRRGEQHGRSILTRNDVNSILSSKGSCREVAVKYGVSPTTISKIRRKMLWAQENSTA